MSKAILVHEKLGEIQDFKNQMTEGEIQLNDILSEYNKLGFLPISSRDQLHMLMNDTRQLLTDQLPSVSSQKIFGMPISRKNVLDIIDVDLTGLVAAIDKADKTAVARFIDHCRIDKGTVKPDYKALSDTIDTKRIYATTDSEMTLYNSIQAIKESAEYLHNFGLKFSEISKLFKINMYNNNTVPEINEGMYLHLCEQARRKAQTA